MFPFLRPRRDARGMVRRLMIGCDVASSPPEAPPLLKVGESVLTAIDFTEAFELNKIAYDYKEMKENPEIPRQARIRFLNQMIERLLIRERARELGIDVSETELDTAVNAVKQGYPEGEFEKTLTESAISPRVWRTELRARLLMEKVVLADLAAEASAEEIAAFRRNAAGKPETTLGDTAIAGLIRRGKMEQSYQRWMEGLRRRYSVHIDQQQMAKLMDAA